MVLTAAGIVGAGTTLIVTLAVFVGSLTDFAVTVTTVGFAVRVVLVAGGLYVAAVAVVLVSVPQADAEHVGVPQSTPVVSPLTAAVIRIELCWPCSICCALDVSETDTPLPPQPGSTIVAAKLPMTITHTNTARTTRFMTWLLGTQIRK